MSKRFPMVLLGEVIRYRQEFVQINDLKTYKRCRVQLHAKGIVLRDIVSGAEIKTKKQQVCRAGEFLVAEIDAKVGGFGIVPGELDGAIVSSHYFLFQLNENVLNKRFLDYFIRTPTFREQVNAQGTTNYAAIRPKDVLEYKIPLPPLSEQRRIVARIEELTAKIEEARRLRLQVMKETEALLCAEMAKFFNNEQKKCTVLPIGESPIELNRETRNPSKTNPNVEFQYLDISSVEGGTGRILNTQTLLGCDAPSRARRVIRQGDIVISTVRPNLKSFTIVPSELDNQICSTGFAVFSCHTDIEPKFLLYQMFSNYFVDQCTASMKGGHYPALNERNLLRINLILPPISEQCRIVAYLDNLQAKVDQLKHLQTETEAEIDALLPSILDKAFKGEL